jgi:hypothetical protein
MSYRNILINEISSVVDGLMNQKKIIDASKVTDVICKNHSDELLYQNADFSRFNIYSNVRREVRSFVSKKLGTDDEQAIAGQLTLDGFRHVQQYYAIERKGIPLVVPIEQMSDKEIEEKAAWHRKCGKAHFEHARELMQYYQAMMAKS